MDFLGNFPHIDGIDLHHVQGVDLDTDLHHAMQHIFEGFSSNGEVALGKITETRRADLLIQYKKAYDLLGQKLELNKEITKWTMLPIFGASLLLPTSFHEALTPVFVALGIHLGTEGAKRYDKIINKMGQSAKHFAENHHLVETHAYGPEGDQAPRATITPEQALKNMRFAMRLTAVEVAFAGVGSVYHLSTVEQLMTMGAYYAMTTYGTWGLSRFMIGMHQVGVSMMTSDYDHASQRDKAKHLFGYRLTRMADKIYRNSQSLAALAKLLTSGRVLDHALGVIAMTTVAAHQFAEKMPAIMDVMKQVPGVEGWLTEKLAIGGMWFLVGSVVGVGGLVAHKLAYPTIEKHVVKPLHQLWMAAAEIVEKNRHVQTIMTTWDMQKLVIYNRTVDGMHRFSPYLTSGPLAAFGLGALQMGMHAMPMGTGQRARKILARSLAPG